MRKNGESNPVTILLVIAIVAGGFYTFHVAPLYMDNLEVKEAVTEAFNNYFNVGGEKKARDTFLLRMNDSHSKFRHLEIDEETGAEVEKPGFGFTDDDISFDESDDKVLRVRVAYKRTVTFKPLKYKKTFSLVAEKKGKQLE